MNISTYMYILRDNITFFSYIRYRIISNKKSGVILGWQNHPDADIFYSSELPPDCAISVYVISMNILYILKFSCREEILQRTFNHSLLCCYVQEVSKIWYPRRSFNKLLSYQILLASSTNG